LIHHDDVQKTSASAETETATRKQITGLVFLEIKAIFAEDLASLAAGEVNRSHDVEMMWK
jgi:hypothetical protein